MKFFSYLLLSYIIKYIITEEYCDKDKSCETCTFCGKDTNDYCSCNFNNTYCLKLDNKSVYFSSDFLLNYDGCLTNNEKEGICGASNISINDGQTVTINFKSVSEENFVCYYSIKGKREKNKFTVKINKDENENASFDLYIITYELNSSKIMTSVSDSAFKSSLEIIKSNIEKISIYLNVREGINLDKISLNFLYNEFKEDKTDDTTTTVKKSKSSSSNTKLIIGILVGAGGLIIIAIVITILCLKFRKKKRLNSLNNNSVVNTINNSTLNPEFKSVINSNKQKLDSMFEMELTPKIFKKSNISNDCYNCTICMENFIDNSSVIITTKCNHNFHEKCFKNWAYKNIVCPKCPNCNDLILGPLDNNLQNITIPSSIDYTIQTNKNPNTTA